jgi:O-antigen ligase
MLYPLIILIIIDLIPALLRGDKWPSATLPLVLFFLATLVSTVIALVDHPDALMGQTAPERAIRGLVTVGVGITTYVVCLNRLRTDDDFRWSVRWLLLGFSLALALGLLQYSRITLRWPYYVHLNSFHRLISVRDVHTLRVTGMAYEPSWFADQLSVLVLPLLFAGILTGYRIFGRSVVWQVVGLAAAGMVLVGTYSRGGVVVSVIAIALGAVLQLVRNRRRVWAALRKGLDQHNRTRWVAAPLLAIGVILLLVFFVYQLSLSPYFTRLWSEIEKIDNPTAYLLSIGGGPRLGLISASYSTFEDSPWLGVGLGQSGFYILDRLPHWIFNKENEVLDMLVPGAWVFPNPKAVWVRLLAETGIVGFALFAVFMLILVVSSLRLLERNSRRAQFVGLFGIMSLLAVILEGFSLDSFALPTWWVAFALISATVWNADREEHADG